MSSPGVPVKRQVQRPLGTVALCLLPILSIAGFYCLMIQAGSNGTFDKINANLRSEKPLFPGSGEELITKYSGVKIIDKQLAVLVTFFAPVVQGTNKALSLYLRFGFGQFGAGWTLLMMESLRRGNHRRAVSFISIYGFFVQNLSFAVSTPLYLFLHLLTSPDAKPFPSAHASSVLLISSYDLAILPFSITLSYIIPSVLMAFPGAAEFGSPVHQYYISFWQAFPIWTVIIQWVLRRISILILGQPTLAKQNKSPAAPSTTYLVSAGRVYTFVLFICVTTTVPVVVLTLLPPQCIPTTVPSLSRLAEETFSSVFIPPLPFLGGPVNDMSEGVHIFLQWDVYIASLASLLWGIVLYHNAAAENEIVDSKITSPVDSQLSAITKASSFQFWPKILLKITLWTLVAGPFGALTILLWERDAILKQKVKQGV